MLAGTDAFFRRLVLDRGPQEKQTEQGTEVKENKTSTVQEERPEDNISVSNIWYKVADNIDVREASPREIIDLSSQLYKADAISYDDYINLSFQPEVNPDAMAESKPFSHERKDYMALWQTKEQKVIRTGGDRYQIEETHRIQAILAYVDSLK